MNKSLVAAIFLITCIFSNVVFAADKERQSICDLMPWKGDSVPVLRLYNNEAGEKFYEKILENLPEGYTKKMAKDFIHGLYEMKIKTFSVVDENTIQIDDKLTGDYVHVCTISMGKEKKPTWQVFITDSKEMVEAGYKYIMLLPLHQHGEDGLRHFHLRYGNENFDFLTTDPSVKSWFPTVYQPAKINEAKATEQMTTPKLARLYASMMKKEGNK